MTTGWKLYVMAHDGLEPAAPLGAETVNLQQIAREEGLKRASRSMAITGPALRAARRALTNVEDTARTRTGIIATAGPVNAAHCIKFLERPLAGAAHLTNPQDFPHTLVSALPTSIAEMLGAKAFAFSMGEDVLAVHEVFAAAFDLLNADMAGHVIAVFASSYDPESALSGPGEPSDVRRRDCAIAFCISLTPFSGSVAVSDAAAQSSQTSAVQVQLDEDDDLGRGFGPAAGGYALAQLIQTWPTKARGAHIRLSAHRATLSLRIDRR